MPGLSKSRLAAFQQCPKRLWLEVHRRDLLTYGDAAQRRFDVGHAVGELARRFPLVVVGREVRHDLEYEGATLKQGEMVVAPTPLTVEITAHLPVTGREHEVRFRDHMRREVFDQRDLRRRSARGPACRRKTLAIHQKHPLGSLAALGLADAAPPFWAGENVPSTKTSTPSMFVSNTSVPSTGGGACAARMFAGRKESSMLGSKLPRSDVGFCWPLLASRTLRRT